MGDTLTNQNIQDTYEGLIKTNGCNENLCNTFTTLTDGIGNNSSLSIATANNGICVTGNATLDGGATVCNTLLLPDRLINDSTGTRITLGADTTLNSNLQLQGDVIKSGSGSTKICLGDATNIVTLNSDATVCGNLIVNGTINATGDIIAFCSSDSRLKDNLNQIDTSAFFDNLTGYSFDWNDESDKEGSSYGFLAQDIEKIAPELVKERPDGYKAVDYIPLIAVLFEEIKTLKEKVSKLEN